MSYSSLSFSSVVHSISPSLSSLLLSLLHFSFLPSHGFFSEGALPAAQARFGTEPGRKRVLVLFELKSRDRRQQSRG